jgi:hypothetical protein
MWAVLGSGHACLRRRQRLNALDRGGNQARELTRFLPISSFDTALPRVAEHLIIT